MEDTTATSGTEETTQATAATEEKTVETPSFADVDYNFRRGQAEKSGKVKEFDAAFPKASAGIDEGKKAEAKTETKEEAKPEVKKPEVKAEPVKETEATRDIGKLRRRLAESRRELDELKGRLSALETPKRETTQVVEGPKAPIEPKREDFKGDSALEDYIAALQKYNKDVRVFDQQQQQTSKERETVDAAWNQRVERFNSRVAEYKKTHPDWDTKAAKTTVSFEPVLLGVLLDSGPETLEHFADNPKEARRLNDLSETSAIAVGSADDLDSVLRYLSANPVEIIALNGLSPAKASKFVGRIEQKIESAKSTQTPDKKVNGEDKGDKDDQKARTSSGASATQAKPDTGGEVTTKVTERAGQEPPPKLKGNGSPNVDNWRDPAMDAKSFRDFETAYNNDPRHRRR